MIDAFAHLEMTEADPLADLGMRLTEAGLYRALLVETWDGKNRHLLEDLTRSPDPRFLLGLCCRAESSPRPDPLLENAAVTALRIGCSQIAGADAWLEAVSALDKLLLLHSDTGLQDLLSALIPVVKRYPSMRMYVPHLGWPDQERIQEWRDAISCLAEMPNVILGVSAIAYFSRQPFPHDDVRLFAEHVVDAFGQARVVSASAYPLDDNARYVDYIRLSRAWIKRRLPVWDDIDALQASLPVELRKKRE